MEFAIVPINATHGKRLPIPDTVVSQGRAAVGAYIDNPPAKALDAAETVPLEVAPAEPTAPASEPANEDTAEDLD